MAKESIVFPFADGLKDVKVGDLVYFVNRNHFYTNRYPTISDLHELKVSKIGSKYLFVIYRTGKEAGSFNIINGKENSPYTGGKLYSSIESFENAMKESKVIEKVKESVRVKLNTLTYPEAMVLAQALNISWTVE